MGVSRLTGKNSTVIRQATQNATEKTADQFGRETSLVCGLVVGWICSVMASPEDKNVRKSRAVYHQKCDGFNVLTTFVVFNFPEADRR
jgi:hypothetical protein